MPIGVSRRRFISSLSSLAGASMLPGKLVGFAKHQKPRVGKRDLSPLLF